MSKFPAVLLLATVALASTAGAQLTKKQLAGAERIASLTVPSPAEFFVAIDKAGHPDWMSFYRDPAPTTYPTRPRTALNLGALVTDGFVAVEAQEAAFHDIGWRGSFRVGAGVAAGAVTVGVVGATLRVSVPLVWLLVPSVPVARTVKVFAPAATGTAAKEYAPEESEVAVAPVSTSFTGVSGEVVPLMTVVASVVVPSVIWVSPAAV